MNPKLLEIFKGQTEKLFGFLSSDYSFAAPQVLVKKHTSLVVVTFKGQNLAIQLLLDERDEDIDCKIARVSNGKVTDDYSRDDTGRLVRDSVFTMLMRKGVKANLFTKVLGMSFEKRIPVTLEDFATMLKEYGKDILADSPSVFD